MANIIVAPEDMRILGLQPGWNVVNDAVASNDTIAPDGTTTAERVYQINSGLMERKFLYGLDPSPILNSLQHWVSVFVKAGPLGTPWILLAVQWINGFVTGRLWFNPNTGALGTNQNLGSRTKGVISYPNGWYRVYFDFLAQPTGTGTFAVGIDITLSNGGFINYNAPPFYDMYVWGAKLEQAASLSSYIAVSGWNSDIAPPNAPILTSAIPGFNKNTLTWTHS